jgi:hypothetical protein
MSAAVAACSSDVARILRENGRPSRRPRYPKAAPWRQIAARVRTKSWSGYSRIRCENAAARSGPATAEVGEPETWKEIEVFGRAGGKGGGNRNGSVEMAVDLTSCSSETGMSKFEGSESRRESRAGDDSTGGGGGESSPMDSPAQSYSALKHRGCGLLHVEQQWRRAQRIVSKKRPQNYYAASCPNFSFSPGTRGWLRGRTCGSPIAGPYLPT